MTDLGKKLAAYAAVDDESLQDGWVVGVGTGRLEPLVDPISLMQIVSTLVTISSVLSALSCLWWTA